MKTSEFIIWCVFVALALFGLISLVTQVACGVDQRPSLPPLIIAPNPYPPIEHIIVES